MTVEPLRTVRDHLSELVDRAEREHERVVVTRNGRPAAVLIGYEDLEALEETLEILSDPVAMAELAEAEAAVAAGEVVHGVDAVRALRPGKWARSPARSSSTRPLTAELAGSAQLAAGWAPTSSHRYAVTGADDCRPAFHAVSARWAMLREALRSACATTPHDRHAKVA